MVYDQAFYVELKESGRKFTANFKYTLKSASDDLSTLKAAEYERFDSVCTETMVGFLQTKTGISCAYAVQKTAANKHVALEERGKSAFIQPNRRPPHPRFDYFEDQTEILATVTQINEMELSWQAGDYVSAAP